MLDLIIKKNKYFFLVVIHEIIHTSYRFIRIFELYKTESKKEQPYTPHTPPSLQFCNDLMCPIKIEIIHGSHRFVRNLHMAWAVIFVNFIPR